MKKIKVLIADDIEIIAKTNQQIAEKNELVDVIGIAYDGQQEYNMIIDLKPDIVVTDNQMPKMNGVEVAEKIINSSLESIPKFILVTADFSYDFNQKCFNIGISQVVNKNTRDIDLPFALDEIISEFDINKNENFKNFEPSQEYKEWYEKYCNDEVVDLKKYFTQEDFEIIKKLGIEILDKIYTEREFEVLDGEYISYYYEDEMTDEEKAETKSLEGTGVSREEYNTLLKKFEKINFEHNF